MALYEELKEYCDEGGNSKNIRSEAREIAKKLDPYIELNKINRKVEIGGKPLLPRQESKAIAYSDKLVLEAYTQAIKQGDVKVVHLLVTFQRNNNTILKNIDRKPALELAAKKGERDLMREVLKTPISKDTVNSALVIAAENGHRRFFDALLNNEYAKPLIDMKIKGKSENILNENLAKKTAPPITSQYNEKLRSKKEKHASGKISRPPEELSSSKKIRPNK